MNKDIILININLSYAAGSDDGIIHVDSWISAWISCFFN